MTIKELKKEAKDLVIALNSQGPNYGDPFPWGNKELHSKTIKFYQESKISFNKFSGLWRVGK
jgi:hypothetical protein